MKQVIETQNDLFQQFQKQHIQFIHNIPIKNDNTNNLSVCVMEYWMNVEILSFKQIARL